MNRNYVTIASIILGLTILLALFFQGNNPTSNPNKTPHSPNPSPKSETNIILDSPKDNSEVSTSFNITGLARVFENTFSFRLKNARTGKNYAESSTITDAKNAGVFGKFNFLLDFGGNATDIKDGDSLILEVFQHSPKDGTEMGKVTSILKYKSVEKAPVKLYFLNPSLSKDFQCAQVFPVDRSIDKSLTPGEDSLKTLLQGPSDTDRAKGYTTKLDPKSTLNKLTITNNQANVDLSIAKEPTEKCDIDSIVSQITKTLEQFPTIKKVTITINNQPLQ